MATLQKEEGKKEKCPICGDSMVCQNKPYQGKDNLSWRNPDGTAHYNFNFKDKSTTCNRAGSEKSPEQPTKTAQQSSPAVSLDKFEFKEITSVDKRDAIANKARKIFEEKVIVGQVSKEPQFAGLGFDNPMSVGQVVGILEQS